MGNVTVGIQQLICSFLRGANRLRPPVSPRIPTGYLSLVLDAFSCFEPLAQAVLKCLSMMTAFLIAVTSVKRVGELHALSISEPCLRWDPGGSGVTYYSIPA